MTKFYTVLGFAPDPFTQTTSSGYRDADTRVHSFGNPGAARRFRTQAGNNMKRNGASVADFRILATTVHDDGTIETTWLA
jgi:hypothetical protein